MKEALAFTWIFTLIDLLIFNRIFTFNSTKNRNNNGNRGRYRFLSDFGRLISW